MSVLQIRIETGQFQLNTLPHEPDQTPSQNLENPDFAFEHFRQKSRSTKAFRMGPYISGRLDGMDSDRYGWVRTHTDAKFALSRPFPFPVFTIEKSDRKNGKMEMGSTRQIWHPYVSVPTRIDPNPSRLTLQICTDPYRRLL